MRLVFFILLSLNVLRQNAQSGFIPINNFGNNPASLSMFAYIPPSINLSQPCPLVIALHGCSQTALACSQETGWNDIADKNNFIVLYPEQNLLNNSSNCFNWFTLSNQQRGGAEPTSIVSMINYMKNNFPIDSNKIYVSGLSAGGAMASIMMACYPEIFDKGAIFSGIPYTNTSGLIQANSQMQGMINKTASQLGNLILSANPGFQSNYPEVAIFHGNNDLVVNYMNQQEQIEQWTFVHQTDSIVDLSRNNFSSNPIVSMNTYYKPNGKEVVRAYSFNGVGHIFPIDVGTCYQQAGQSGNYSFDINFSGAFWAADFFGITEDTSIRISGADTVLANSSNINYSVNGANGYYLWDVPAGASIISGQGTNQVIINFGNNSGNVSVSIANGNCVEGPINFPVEVINANAVIVTKNNKDLQFIINNEEELEIINPGEKIDEISIHGLDGKCLQKNFPNYESKIKLGSQITTGIYLLCVVKQSASIISKKIFINKQ